MRKRNASSDNSFDREIKGLVVKAQQVSLTSAVYEAYSLGADLEFEPSLSEDVDDLIDMIRDKSISLEDGLYEAYDRGCDLSSCRFS